MKIGQALLIPYYRSKPRIIVTAIEITDEATPKVKVFWSRKLVNDLPSAGPAKGTITTVPVALNTRGSFLVRVESELDYKPVITWARRRTSRLGLTSMFDNIAMKETYYLRPRMSSQVVCTDC